MLTPDSQWGGEVWAGSFELTPAVQLREGATLDQAVGLEDHRVAGVAFETCLRHGFLLFDLDRTAGELMAEILQILRPELEAVEASWALLGGTMQRGAHPIFTQSHLWRVTQLQPPSPSSSGQDGSAAMSVDPSTMDPSAMDFSRPLREQLNCPGASRHPLIVWLQCRFPVEQFPFETLVFRAGNGVGAAPVPCDHQTTAGQAAAAWLQTKNIDLDQYEEKQLDYLMEQGLATWNTQPSFPESWLLLHPLRDDAAKSTVLRIGSGNQFFLKGLDGKTHTIECPLEADVADLKVAVYLRTGVNVSEQRLIFSGKQLENGLLLLDYGLQAESTIHLVLRLRGSDSSLKRSVRLLHGPLQPPHFLPFSWYSYSYRADPSHSSCQGVIAQQIVSSHPSAVSFHSPSGFLAVDYCALGLPVELLSLVFQHPDPSFLDCQQTFLAEHKAE